MSDVFRDDTFGCCCKCILGVNTAHYKTLMQWYMVHLRATECAGVESHMSRGAVKCDVMGVFRVTYFVMRCLHVIGSALWASIRCIATR